jgi:hypothetical protein
MGLLIYKDGTIYQGNFTLGKKNKKGVLYLPNGDTIDGTWKNDKIGEASYTKGNPSKVSKYSLKC